jgi:hypothetical protein
MADGRTKVKTARSGARGGWWLGAREGGAPYCLLVLSSGLSVEFGFGGVFVVRTVVRSFFKKLCLLGVRPPSHGGWAGGRRSAHAPSPREAMRVHPRTCRHRFRPGRHRSPSKFCLLRWRVRRPVRREVVHRRKKYYKLDSLRRVSHGAKQREAAPQSAKAFCASLV